MLQFDRVAFEEGRAAYHSGMALDGVVLRIIADFERSRFRGDRYPEDDGVSDEAKSKSFTLGFAQGALDDLRKVAGGTRSSGVRA